MTLSKLKANLTNVQRGYMWELIIPSPKGDGDTETIRLRAHTASIPGRSHGAIHVDYKQSAGFNVPGKLRFPQELTFTMIEGEDAKTHEFFYSWMQEINSDETNLGLGDVLIKGTIYMRLLSTNNSETLKLALEGAYPKSVPDVPTDMREESEIRYPVTFSYDRWVKK